MSLKIVSLVLLLACYLHLASALCNNLPVRVPGRVSSNPLSDSNQPTCPSSTESQNAYNQLNSQLNDIIADQFAYFQDISSPPSCPGLGWIKVVDFDLKSNSSLSCPGEWTKGSSGNIHYCTLSTTESTCQSVTYSVQMARYQQVCGRIRGYQLGATTAFFPYSTGSNSNINQAYIDGVVITHGEMPDRKHIWTFASGYSNAYAYPNNKRWMCPCNNLTNDTTIAIPSFISGNFFCSAGNNRTQQALINRRFQEGPLWDGNGCAAGNECCAKQPFFLANLEEPTCNDLEIRICTFTDPKNVGVDLIELYVK